MSWFSTIRYKDPHKKFMKSKKKMTKNIYGSKNEGQHQKRFHVIHYVFKYKFFVPLLMLGRKILNKHLVKKIPNENYNRNIIIFDKAFEESIKKWHLYYLRNSGAPEKRKTRKQMLQRAKDEKYLHTMKEFVTTMYIHDTAYREFMNILMHEIAKDMVDYYAVGEHKTGHLFFTTDIYDVNYYVLEKAVQYQVQIGISDSEAMLREQEARYKNEREQRRKNRRNTDIKQEDTGILGTEERGHVRDDSGVREVHKKGRNTKKVFERTL